MRTVKVSVELKPCSTQGHVMMAYREATYIHCPCGGKHLALSYMGDACEVLTPTKEAERVQQEEKDFLREHWYAQYLNQAVILGVNPGEYILRLVAEDPELYLKFLTLHNKTKADKKEAADGGPPEGVLLSVILIGPARRHDT